VKLVQRWRIPPSTTWAVRLPRRWQVCWTWSCRRTGLTLNLSVSRRIPDEVFEQAIAEQEQEIRASLRVVR
jgi:hypothetical protein